MDTDLRHDGGIIADLCAKLDLHIGSTEKLRKQLAEAQRPPQQPSFGRVRASAIADANGFAFLVFDQGGPQQGLFWYVRNLVVGGLNPAVAANGTADVFVMAGQPPGITDDLTSLGLSDWRDRAAALPSVAYYASGQLALRMNERLYVIITGGTSGQQYIAAASIEEYQEGPVSQAWAL